MPDWPSFTTDVHLRGNKGGTFGVLPRNAECCPQADTSRQPLARTARVVLTQMPPSLSSLTFPVQSVCLSICTCRPLLLFFFSPKAVSVAQSFFFLFLYPGGKGVSDLSQCVSCMCVCWQSWHSCLTIPVLSGGESLLTTKQRKKKKEENNDRLYLLTWPISGRKSEVFKCHEHAKRMNQWKEWHFERLYLKPHSRNVSVFMRTKQSRTREKTNNNNVE